MGTRKTERESLTQEDGKLRWGISFPLDDLSAFDLRYGENNKQGRQRRSFVR